MPRLAAESLGALTPIGPAGAIGALLKALARMAGEQRLASELASLGVADLAMAVIADQRWSQELVLRRFAAEAYARPIVILAETRGNNTLNKGLLSPTLTRNSGLPVTPGKAHEAPQPGLPGAQIACVATLPSAEPTVAASACAAALRRRSTLEPC